MDSALCFEPLWNAQCVSGRVIVGRRQMPWQVHAVVKQSQDINARPGRTEHHKMPPGAPLSSDMQCSNAWLYAFAYLGAQKIRSTLQGLDCERNRLSVVLFSLLTEPNRPKLSHAPEMALEATDAK